MPRINRRKSIHTPPDRSRVSPSRRVPLPDDGGPTEFTLQRKAEVINEGTACRVDDRRVYITGPVGSLTRAEFASSSNLALLFDQNKIIGKQYRAGAEYARLHRVLWGRVTPKPSTLSKVMATALPERIEAANRAAREERDEDSYIEWMQEQRTLFERGEYRLRHIAGETHTSRRLIRIVVRAVAIDDVYPNKPGQVWRLRLGLNELADAYGIE